MKIILALYLTLVIGVGVLINDNNIPNISRERVVQTAKAEQTKTDETRRLNVERLQKVFKKYNSPLYYEAENLVNTAEVYHLDYRLLPAIAFAESTLCKNYIRSSYNCWGWGSGKIYFSSFKEAMEKIGYGLSTLSYYANWRTNQSDIYKLSLTYNAAGVDHWTYVVTGFMEEVENE